jgi:DNA-binding NarL/FixJ family response regulator
MKKIKITLASDEGGAMAGCAEILDDDPAIERVASLTDLTGHGTWLALACSQVLLIDEALVLRDGFEPVNMLLSSYPEVHCLLVLNSPSRDKAMLALMQGVRGVLTIGEIQPLLIKAIAKLMAGEIWAPRHLMQPIREDLRQIDDGSYIYRQPEKIKELVKWH